MDDASVASSVTRVRSSNSVRRHHSQVEVEAYLEQDSEGKFTHPDHLIVNYKHVDEKLNAVNRGRQAVQLARDKMSGLVYVEEMYKDKKPLTGAHLIVCLHITAPTAVFVHTLIALGAQVRWSGSNVYSTQDDVAAYMAVDEGVPVFGWAGESEHDFWWCMKQTLKPERPDVVWEPNMIVDDGGDATHMVHKYPKIAEKIRGITEDSTLGVHRLYQMAMTGRLMCPAINVSDSVTKSKFENYYGCRETMIDAIRRGTDMMIAGRQAIVCGFGAVGKACAAALRSAGATVYVTEIDPICALQACMEGFRVIKLETAVEFGEIFVTATGNRDVIMRRHMDRMKNGAVLVNIGHYDLEIDVEHVKDLHWENIKPHVDLICFPDGKKITLLAEGHLANVSLTGNSKPAFVLSVGYTNQVLAQIELFTAPQNKYKNEVFRLPRHLDEQAARAHLGRFHAELEELAPEQAKYLGIQIEGPYKPSGYRY
eukprot:TRINITY_DN2922_c0_g1_i2.p1 TRINITY_DN2922_c0_g1~~TRINITY_DN2922_c0_g1_i2.p1  ORF type:complete len:482 (+),score=111.83 TRINITY_DN2922_c0_g1_i2:282-1727(+)